MGRSTTLTRVARMRSLTQERIQHRGRWSKIHVIGAKSVVMKGGNVSLRWLKTSSYSGSPRVSSDDSERKFISFSFVASYSVGKGDMLSVGSGVMYSEMFGEKKLRMLGLYSDYAGKARATRRMLSFISCSPSEPLPASQESTGPTMITRGNGTNSNASAFRKRSSVSSKQDAHPPRRRSNDSNCSRVEDACRCCYLSWPLS